MLQNEDKLVLNIDSLQHKPGQAIPHPEVLSQATPMSPSDNWEWLAYSVGYRMNNAAIIQTMLTQLKSMDRFKRGECNVDQGHSVLWLFGILFIIVTAKTRKHTEIEKLAREHLRQWVAQNMFGLDKPMAITQALARQASQRQVAPAGDIGWRVEYALRVGSGVSFATVELAAGMKAAGNNSSANQAPFTLRRFLEAEGGAALQALREEEMPCLGLLKSSGWKELAKRCIIRRSSKTWTYVRFTDGSYLTTLDQRAGIPPTRFLAYYDAATRRLEQFPDYPEGRSDPGTGGSTINWDTQTARAWDADNGKSKVISFAGKTVECLVIQSPTGVSVTGKDGGKGEDENVAPEPTSSPTGPNDPPLVDTSGQGRPKKENHWLDWL